MIMIPARIGTGMGAGKMTNNTKDNSLCFAHNKPHVYPKQQCPYCRIDFLEDWVETRNVRVYELETEVVDLQAKLSRYEDVVTVDGKVVDGGNAIRITAGQTLPKKYLGHFITVVVSREKE